nr:EOG090X09TV [Sida crystallina]
MAMARNLEQVINILNLAKFSESDVKKECHVLQFTPQILDSKQVKILEVTKDTLQYINSGENLYIKGGENPTAVICTNSITFELKEAETSNSLLLMPTLDEATTVEEVEGHVLKNQQVYGVYHTYYEMKKVKPRLASLRNILLRHAYKGKEVEDGELLGITFSELKKTIQASESEIFNRLNELQAVKIKGTWRLLDVGLLYSWVTNLDGILREKNVTIEDVTAQEVINWSSTFELDEVNQKCASIFLEDKGEFCLWNQAAVSQLFALYLLPVLKAFDSKDFFSTWQQSMPPGVQVSEEHLRGIALVDNESTPSLVRYLPEFDLPEDINDRLEILFRTRTKWTLSDISPYIQPLTEGQLNVNALLTKYTRSSTIQGVKYYSSKYLA